MQGTNPVNLIVTINGARTIPYEGIRYVGTGGTTSGTYLGVSGNPSKVTSNAATI